MAFDYEQLGNRIRKLRKNKKITQEKMAEQIGLTSAQIYNIESAKSRPSVESLINMSDVLKVPVDELLFGYIRYTNEDPYEKELSDIISDCSNNEKHVIVESSRTLRNLLKEYVNTGN